MGPDYWMGNGFGFMWIFPVIFLLVFVFFMRGMFGRIITRTTMMDWLCPYGLIYRLKKPLKYGQ